MKRKIYIAISGMGDPTAVVLAPDKDKANIALHAMGADAYSVEEIDPESDGGIAGVIFLLSSVERRLPGIDSGTERRWYRGTPPKN